MKIFKYLLIMFCFLSTLMFVNNGYANENIPNTPKDVEVLVNPIVVEFEGNDSIGSMLSTRLKEIFNSSNLFVLEGKDIPKFRIMISSVPEFDTRPAVGSAYSIVWLFSLSEATLRHFLATEVGVISADGVNDLATKLVEKTDNLVNRYSYLFPQK